jgi:putative NADH-flavin reductase
MAECSVQRADGMKGSRMKILIFGSTGSMGRRLVDQALEQGHSVTAFARDATKVGVTHDNLQIAEGDAMDPEPVERAVEGHEAVLSALGGMKRSSPVRSEGTRNVINAMEEVGCAAFDLPIDPRHRR